MKIIIDCESNNASVDMVRHAAAVAAVQEGVEPAASDAGACAGVGTGQTAGKALEGFGAPGRRDMPPAPRRGSLNWLIGAPADQGALDAGAPKS